MSQELNHDGSITVTAYSLHEFAFELCELAAKGFVTTMENNKAVSGGFGSYYTGILVPRHAYRIDLQGNHLNTPETTLKASTTPITDQSNTPLAKDEAKTTESVTSPVKTTRATKKTT